MYGHSSLLLHCKQFLVTFDTFRANYLNTSSLC
jgi:hypothetical protein